MKNIRVLIDNSHDKICCNSTQIDCKNGDKVIVSINKILFSGKVIDINSNTETETENKILRIINDNDIEIIKKNTVESDKALIEAKKIKSKMNLNMSFVDAYYTFDKKQLYFLFVADTRIDFRELAKKLADRYRTRIELRQIGIRDKSKKIGGIGPCGLFLCCNSFLTDFNSVSINMAKNQFLALNPSKINGVCGRLLCCLKYEDETYKDLKSGTPKIGSLYETNKGMGKVISIDIFNKNISVEMRDRSIVIINYEEKDESTK